MLIRALCIADRPAGRPLDLLVAEMDAEIVICLGDLGAAELPGLERVKLPKIGVHGNHCGRYFAELGIDDLHLRTGLYRGISFGGFEGCHRYKNEGRYQYTQEQASTMLAGFPAVDVMVCHCPPAGCNDDPDDPAHEGFQALADYLARAKPQVLLHGHTYPRCPLERVGTTRIIYVHGVELVELDL